MTEEHIVVTLCRSLCHRLHVIKGIFLACRCTEPREQMPVVVAESNLHRLLVNQSNIRDEMQELQRIEAIGVFVLHVVVSSNRDDMEILHAVCKKVDYIVEGFHRNDVAVIEDVAAKQDGVDTFLFEISDDFVKHFITLLVVVVGNDLIVEESLPNMDVADNSDFTHFLRPCVQFVSVVQSFRLLGRTG